MLDSECFVFKDIENDACVVDVLHVCCSMQRTPSLLLAPGECCSSRRVLSSSPLTNTMQMGNYHQKTSSVLIKRSICNL